MKTPTLTQRPQIVANEDFNGTTNSLNEALKACKKGNEEVVNHLIAAKVDVNVADIYRFTPLMIASQAGHEAIVEKLIKSADINVKGEHGKTALMLACSRWHIYIKEANRSGSHIDRHSSEVEIFAVYIALMMIIQTQSSHRKHFKRKRDQDDEAIGTEKSAKTLEKSNTASCSVEDKYSAPESALLFLRTTIAQRRPKMKVRRFNSLQPFVEAMMRNKSRRNADS